MSDAVFQAPGAELDAPAGSSPIPSADLDPVEVARRVWADLTANPVGFFLAGLAYFVTVMGVVVIAISVLGLGLAPGIVMEDDTVLTIGGIIGTTIYTLAILGFSLVGVPLMTAGMLRHLDDQQRGEGSLGFGSLFAGAGGRAGPVIRFYLLANLGVFVGMLFCYLPGLVMAALSAFALPIAVFEDVGPVEAITRGLNHMRAEPIFHLATWLMLMCAALAAEMTVIGILLIFPIVVAWQYHAYKIAFPEGSAA